MLSLRIDFDSALSPVLGLLYGAQECWIHRGNLGGEKRVHAEEQTLQYLALQFLWRRGSD